MPRPSLAVNGAEIRSRRLARRIEVAELAEQAGIHRDYLYNIELGHKKRVSVTVLRSIEHILGRLDEPDPPITDEPVQALGGAE
ncbi:helix-turn-helix transcriptional regulator [Frankia sp. Cr1]|uniref:helix-turn-helix domain-containing protein n=1 Tax=Frankia sp. Cr1 TaxID=3073931 RepID=UPI002AD41BC1|nr:helix-turn-helix transcriptional regulator [Frankia sp. Cr1]